VILREIREADDHLLALGPDPLVRGRKQVFGQVLHFSLASFVCFVFVLHAESCRLYALLSQQTVPQVKRVLEFFP
jgi:hypothetical protein